MATPTRNELIEEGAAILRAAVESSKGMYNIEATKALAEVGKGFALLAQAAPADIVQAKGPATPGFQDTVNRHGGV